MLEHLINQNQLHFNHLMSAKCKVGFHCASEKKMPCNTSHLRLNVFLVDENHLETSVSGVRC